MQVPSVLQGESRTRLLQGAFIGFLATVVIGFGWAGWTFGSTASKMALAANEAGKLEILAPICVAQFNGIDGAMAKFQALATYNRDTLVRDSMKTVGGTEMSWTLARECQRLLEIQVSKSAALKS